MHSSSTQMPQWRRILMLIFALLSHWQSLAQAGRSIKITLTETGFHPGSETAQVGDVIIIKYTIGGASLTQSTSDSPCVPLKGGIDSGLKSINQEFIFTVKSDDDMFFFNRQTSPKNFCKAGSVFAVASMGKASVFKRNAMTSESSWIHIRELRISNSKVQGSNIEGSNIEGSNISAGLRPSRSDGIIKVGVKSHSGDDQDSGTIVKGSNIGAGLRPSRPDGTGTIKVIKSHSGDDHDSGTIIKGSNVQNSNNRGSDTEGSNIGAGLRPSRPVGIIKVGVKSHSRDGDQDSPDSARASGGVGINTTSAGSAPTDASRVSSITATPSTAPSYPQNPTGSNSPARSGDPIPTTPPNSTSNPSTAPAAAPAAAPIPTSTPTAEHASQRKKNLAAKAVGISFGIFALALVLFFVMRWRRRRTALLTTNVNPVQNFQGLPNAPPNGMKTFLTRLISKPRAWARLDEKDLPKISPFRPAPNSGGEMIDVLVVTRTSDSEHPGPWRRSLARTVDSDSDNRQSRISDPIATTRRLSQATLVGGSGQRTDRHQSGTGSSLVAEPSESDTAKSIIVHQGRVMVNHASTSPSFAYPKSGEETSPIRVGEEPKD